MRVLLASFSGYIKGYGLLSDLEGHTFHGVPLAEAERYKNFEEEFIEDKSLDPYHFNVSDCPSQIIPRGTLNVYAEAVK